MIDAFLNVRTILANLDTIPVMLRGLVKAIAGFAIGILRSLIGIVMFQLVVTGVPLIAKTMTGRSISLIQFSRLFTPVKKFIDACAGRFSLCKLIPKAFPKLPCVVGVLTMSTAVIGAYYDDNLSWKSGGQYTVEAFDAASDCKNWTPSGRTIGDEIGDQMDGVCANSFTAETGVLLADGSVVRIDQIREGDRVEALDPRTGERGANAVTNVVASTGSKRLIQLTLTVDDGTMTLNTTPEHPFWLATVAEWRFASDLRSGDLVLTADASFARVQRIDERAVGRGTVYNLSVAETSTYFVTDSARNGLRAVLVHNIDCDEFARRLQKQIGGEVKSIYPRKAPGQEYETLMGQYALAPDREWFHHTVVVKDGRVYDEFTGRDGMPIDEWKSKWAYPDALDFPF